MLTVELSGEVGEDFAHNMRMAGHTDPAHFIGQLLREHSAGRRGTEKVLHSRVESLRDSLAPRVVDWGPDGDANLHEVGVALESGRPLVAGRRGEGQYVLMTFRLFCLVDSTLRRVGDYLVRT